MEMVARGLEKHLKVDQREFLMNMLAGFCDEESRRSAAEALGLVSFFGISTFLFVKLNLGCENAKYWGLFDSFI